VCAWGRPSSHAASCSILIAAAIASRFQLGRHKARCVAVRLLMPPVENRTYHFHGIRLSTCGLSPCAHEAFLPMSPAPQCFPRGQLARSLGTSGPGFPLLRLLRPIRHFLRHRGFVGVSLTYFPLPFTSFKKFPVFTVEDSNRML
jgi:hypothetical protein